MMNTDGDAILVGGVMIHIIPACLKDQTLYSAVQCAHHTTPFSLSLLDDAQWWLTNMNESLYVFKYLKEPQL